MPQDHPLPPPQDIARTLTGAGIFIFAQDAQLRYQWVENPPAGWEAQDISGKTDFDILPQATAAILDMAKRTALASRRAGWTELILCGEEDPHRFDIYLRPEVDPNGQPTGLLGLAIDVTHRHASPANTEALARDSVHRSKNLLSMVQSLATQTAKCTAYPDEFVEDFRGRIQVISRALDLQATSGRVRLSDIVAAEVEAPVADSGRVILTGGNFVFSANAALHIGLALHELGAATLHSDAAIRITADRMPQLDGSTAAPLRLRWEDNEVPTKDMHAFSRTLLERIAPAAVGGTAVFVVSNTGRSYELTVAPNEFG